MAKTRLFGESISPGVIKQLEKRSDVLSAGIRSSNDLRYLNEKTSWVRMISGVNTQLDGVDGFTSKEAEGFILSGGEVKWDGKAFVRRTGFNTSTTEDGTQARYNYDKDLGIRPEAGITSFNIKNIGTYGVLREANLEFNVWTLKDLEKAQNLFLRPGMSIILEWGNSIYLDGDGNVRDTLTLTDPKKYFEQSTAASIADLLKQGRENNFYNYDGFLGYITNFSWSFRGDGGYDCSVKAITKGAVLESISTYRSTQDTVEEFKGTIPVTSDNEDKESSKTYLHYVLKLHEKGIALDNAFDQEIYRSWKREFSNNYLEPTKKESDDNATFFPIKYTAGTKTNLSVYISLNTFCSLLNIAFLFNNPAGDRITSFYTRKKNSNITEPAYVTFEDHFSLNPLYCLLPKVPNFSKEIVVPDLTQGLINREENKNSVYSIYINLVEVVKDLDSIIDGEKSPEQANVFDFVGKVLNKLNSYLGGINSLDLSFDEDLQKWIIVDRNVTLNLENTDQDSPKIEQLNLTGIKSTISDLSLVTKITPQLSSQIAISAQASKINHVSIDLPLADWNANVVDRFASLEEIPVFAEDLPPSVKVLSTKRRDAVREGRLPRGTEIFIPREDLEAEQQEEIEKQNLQKYIDSVTEAYQSLITPENNQAQKDLVTQQTNTFGNTYYSRQVLGGAGLQPETPPSKVFLVPIVPFKKDLFEKLKSESIVRFNNAVYGTTVQGNNTTVNSGLIPIEIQIKLDGIAGLKIGQIFRIGSPTAPSSILPAVYNEYGFVVTGIDSSIENSKWFTTIRGLTFRLENNGVQALGKIKI